MQGFNTPFNMFGGTTCTPTLNGQWAPAIPGYTQIPSPGACYPSGQHIPGAPYASMYNQPVQNYGYRTTVPGFGGFVGGPGGVWGSPITNSWTSPFAAQAWNNPYVTSPWGFAPTTSGYPTNPWISPVQNHFGNPIVNSCLPYSYANGVNPFANPFTTGLNTVNPIGAYSPVNPFSPINPVTSAWTNGINPFASSVYTTPVGGYIANPLNVYNPINTINPISGMFGQPCGHIGLPFAGQLPFNGQFGLGSINSIHNCTPGVGNSFTGFGGHFGYTQPTISPWSALNAFGGCTPGVVNPYSTIVPGMLNGLTPNLIGQPGVYSGSPFTSGMFMGGQLPFVGGHIPGFVNPLSNWITSPGQNLLNTVNPFGTGVVPFTGAHGCVPSYGTTPGAFNPFVAPFPYGGVPFGWQSPFVTSASLFGGQYVNPLNPFAMDRDMAAVTASISPNGAIGCQNGPMVHREAA